MAHGSLLKLNHITVVARTLDEGSTYSERPWYQHP